MRMKKILILPLALLALCSCSDDLEDDKNITVDAEQPAVDGQIEETTVAPDTLFYAVAKKNVNFRSEPSTQGQEKTVLGQLQKGDTVTFTRLENNKDWVGIKKIVKEGDTLSGFIKFSLLDSIARPEQKVELKDSLTADTLNVDTTKTDTIQAKTVDPGKGEPLKWWQIVIISLAALILLCACVIFFLRWRNGRRKKNKKGGKKADIKFDQATQADLNDPLTKEFLVK